MNNDDLTQNFFGIFNKTAEEVSIENEDQNGGNVFFNPDSLNAPNKRYSAIIKFLPNIHNPNSGFVDVQTYTIPNGQSRLVYKTPKSLNRYADCPVANLYFKFNGKDVTDPRLKDIGKTIKWNSRTYALIQVISDTVKPENNGKIMIWQVPKDIKALIEAVRKPSPMKLQTGAKPNNVFDPINGYCLALDIPVENYTDENGKPAQKRNYNLSTFEPNMNTVMIVGDETTQRAYPQGDEQMLEFQKAVIAKLTATETPKLSDYGYKDESAEHVAKCVGVLESMLNGTHNPNVGTTQAQQQPIQAPIQQPQAVAQQPQQAVQQPQAVAQPQQAVQQVQQVQQPQQAVQQTNDVFGELLGGNAE